MTLYLGSKFCGENSVSGQPVGPQLAQYNIMRHGVDVYTASIIQHAGPTDYPLNEAQVCGDVRALGYAGEEHVDGPTRAWAHR